VVNNGVAWEARRAAFAEKLGVLKRLWTEDVVGHQGEHVSFTDSWLWPKPFQRPYPPILIGGAGVDRNLKTIVAMADGWYPVHTPDVPGQLERLRKLAAESGQAPPQVSINYMAGQMPGAPWYWQSSEAMDELLRLADEYRQLDVHRMVIGVPMTNLDEMTAGLDALAELAPRFA